MSGPGKISAMKSEGATPDERKRLLIEAFQEHQQDLLAGIRVYLWQLGVVTNRGSLEERAKELFQDTVITALENPANYDPGRPARVWLLGVAINEIRHFKRRLGLERRLIESVADTPEVHKVTRAAASLKLSEAEMFDLLYRRVGASLGGHTLDELLSVVEESDQRVLGLHFVEGLSGRELGAELRISEGAAYTRLSRAKARLREALLKN